MVIVESPVDTVKVIVVPDALLLPAAGFVFITWSFFISALLSSFWVSDTSNPSSCNFLIASVTVKFLTSGTILSFPFINDGINNITAATNTTNPVNIAARTINNLFSFWTSSSSTCLTFTSSSSS